MLSSFVYSFQSEWLKTRHSLAAWLVVIGGFFIPLIFLCARWAYPDKLIISESPRYWEAIFGQCWQTMSLFLLPMGVVLASSLITQLEFRNNTWKQVHTTPQSLTQIFLAKLAVILTMMFQFFVLFNVGIVIAGVAPNILTGRAYPQEALPWYYFLEKSSLFFLDCLPIVALQYLISLQFKNFLLPLGIGIGMVISSLIALEWKYAYTVPYTYPALYFFEIRGGSGPSQPDVNFHYWAAAYFTGLLLLGYVLYIFKKEK